MTEISDDVYDYITLGDGDFTFSYDMIRFLQAREALTDAIRDTNGISEEVGDGAQKFTRKDVKVVCSGIDPLHELQQKYRDADFILKRIKSLNGQIPTLNGPGSRGSKRQRMDMEGTKVQVHESLSSSCLNVSVHHAVNAIKPWQHGHVENAFSSEKTLELEPSPPLPSNIVFKNVIFNHPHIGTEDAKLHARFLSHFFHSAENHWLAQGGVLHIALAMGQCERWECIERANQHGFTLIKRQTFKAPPSPRQYLQGESKNLGLCIKNSKFQSKEYSRCRYQHRRGHTGRSFKSRVDGSETLSFGRKSDVTMNAIDKTAVNLPWQKFDYEEEMLKCPHCDKSFRDERAKKNHIKCVHANVDVSNDSNKKKLLVCEFCSNLNINGQGMRTFPNEEALMAHIRAKHSSCGTPPESCIVVPDTHLDNNLTVNANADVREDRNNEVDGDPSGNNFNLNLAKCNICGLGFTSIEAKRKHFEEFVPIFKSTPETSSYVCLTCGKYFSQERSLMQHRLVCTVEKQSKISY